MQLRMPTYPTYNSRKRRRQYGRQHSVILPLIVHMEAASSCIISPKVRRTNPSHHHLTTPQPFRFKPPDSRPPAPARPPGALRLLPNTKARRKYHPILTQPTTHTTQPTPARTLKKNSSNVVTVYTVRVLNQAICAGGARLHSMREVTYYRFQ